MKKSATSGYAFCESVHAGPTSPWHIRQLTQVGLKLGGGIDSASLCGHLMPQGVRVGERLGGGGWDLSVVITEHHLSHACQRCAAAYTLAVGR